MAGSCGCGGGADEKRAQVREAYGAVARGEGSCCGPGQRTCGCGEPTQAAEGLSSGMGYSQEELKSLPEGADLGLGCGSPVGKANLKAGEVVLDLGSGAGIDCFLAAQRVGPTGMALGVDMTPEMLARARENARKTGTTNVEFRLGEIEHLPVETASVDVVISNCVLNLVPSKAQAFSDIARVLKPGGRMVVSDVVKLRDLPPHLTMDPSVYCACLGGAIGKEEYLSLLAEAGLEQVEVLSERDATELFLETPGPVSDWLRGLSKEDTQGLAASITVRAVRRGAAACNRGDTCCD